MTKEDAIKIAIEGFIKDYRERILQEFNRYLDICMHYELSGEPCMFTKSLFSLKFPYSDTKFQFGYLSEIKGHGLKEDINNPIISYAFNHIMKDYFKIQKQKK